MLRQVSQNITGDKGDGASLVVVVRGTKNTFDWLANINMWIEVGNDQHRPCMLANGLICSSHAAKLFAGCFHLPSTFDHAAHGGLKARNDLVTDCNVLPI